VTEGLNSKIQMIKSNARGFRSFENYRIRILFFCGKLDLHPLNEVGRKAQYDILHDTFIYPLQEWGEDEGETLMWMPGDVTPPPPE
jgi:hypothetical protein